MTDRKHRSCQHPILVGGCPSSGTTLLSVMLNAHPQIVSGPELAIFSHPFIFDQSGDAWRERLDRYLIHQMQFEGLPDWCWESGVCEFLAFADTPNLAWYGTDAQAVREQLSGWNDVCDLIEFLYGRLLSESGKSWWAEKSPENIYSMQSFLRKLPQGRGIVVVRDGRDVVCSLVQRGFPFRRAVAVWVVDAAISLALAQDDRVKVIRYEDLIRSAATTLRDLTVWLGVEPRVDDMLAYDQSQRAREDDSIRVGSWKTTPQDPLSTASIGRWSAELSAEQVAILHATRIEKPFGPLDALAGTSGRALLERFDYDAGATPVVDVDEFCQWVWREPGFLDPPAGKVGFHERHVSTILNGDLSFTDVLRALAKMKALDSTGIARQEGASSLELTRKELAELRANFASLQASYDSRLRLLKKRTGIWGGIREFLRSSYWAARSLLGHEVEP